MLQTVSLQTEAPRGLSLECTDAMVVTGALLCLADLQQECTSKALVCLDGQHAFSSSLAIVDVVDACSQAHLQRLVVVIEGVIPQVISKLLVQRNNEVIADFGLLHRLQTRERST